MDWEEGWNGVSGNRARVSISELTDYYYLLKINVRVLVVTDSFFVY